MGSAAPQRPAKYRLDTSRHGVPSKVIQLVPPGSRALEIGCASGYFSAKLAEKSCSVYGIEMDPAEAELARANCTDVLTQDVDTLGVLPWAKESFDVILCMDVLEHLKCPQRAVQMVRPYLKSSGILIVSVPNVANWWVRYHLLTGKFHYQPAGILDRTHLRFFTRRSAEEMLTDAGYAITHRDVTPGVASNLYLRTIGRPLQALRRRERLEYRLTRLLPGLFAQQVIFVCRPGAVAPH